MKGSSLSFSICKSLILVYLYFPFLLHAKELPILVSGISVMMPINEPPTVIGEEVIINEIGDLCDDSGVEFNNPWCIYNLDPLTNDTDANPDTLIISQQFGAQDGTARLIGRTIQYTPSHNFFIKGKADPNYRETIHYVVTNQEGLTSTGVITFRLNQAPKASRDGFEVPILSPGNANGYNCYADEVNATLCRFIFDPLANDQGDPEGDAIARIITSRNHRDLPNFDQLPIPGPANGIDYVTQDELKIEFLVDTTCIYLGTNTGTNCDFNKFGQADSTYRIMDIHGALSKPTIITYDPDNKPPTAHDDLNIKIKHNSPFIIDVLANDTDPENGALTIVKTITNPSHGTAVIQNNQLLYTPNIDYIGTDSFTYQIRDDFSETSIATVSVNVLEPNLPPIARNDLGATAIATPVAIDVLSNDSDPENRALTLVGVISNPANGSVVMQGNQLIYTPNSTFSGTDSFTYQIKDDADQSSTATISITVENAIPVTITASWDLTSVNVGQTATLTWNSTNAVQCSSVTHPEIANASGSISVQLYQLGNVTTTIECSNQNSTQSQTISVSINVSKLAAPSNLRQQ